MDIQKSAIFLDIQKLTFGYSKFDFWIAIIRFLDIHNSIFGYSIFSLIYGYPKNRIMDIQNQIMDIQKSIFGYPKILLNLDIPNTVFGYP